MPPFPLLNPLIKLLANRLRGKAAKSLVIPQAGEEANESLREIHVKKSAIIRVSQRPAREV